MAEKTKSRTNITLITVSAFFSHTEKSQKRVIVTTKYVQHAMTMQRFTLSFKEMKHKTETTSRKRLWTIVRMRVRG
jgi:hypothetical protein